MSKIVRLIVEKTCKSITFLVIPSHRLKKTGKIIPIAADKKQEESKKEKR